MRFIEELHAPRGHFAVHLDSKEVFPDDPGNGAPAMVSGPGDASATLWCAADTGELMASDGSVQVVPPNVLSWLQSEAIDRANDFVTAVSMIKQPAADRYRETVCRFVQFWTAFDSLDALLNAQGHYRPSLDMSDPIMVVIADAYDLEQSNRSDPRRAYRYGYKMESIPKAN